MVNIKLHNEEIITVRSHSGDLLVIQNQEGTLVNRDDWAKDLIIQEQSKEN